MNIKVTTDKVPEICRSGYQWLYYEIDHLDNGETVLEEFDNIRELRKHEVCVRNRYAEKITNKDLVVRTRKYRPDGRHIPTLYITRNE